MIAHFSHAETVAKSVVSFHFMAQTKLRYDAGQFIELRLVNTKGNEDKRWFTLSSSPTEPLLSITTKLNEDDKSLFKQSLINLNKGDAVTVSEPMGDFVLPKDDSRPLVFIAGGIGVTPMRSMIKWLHDKQQRRNVHMIYASRSIEDIAFRDLFFKYSLPLEIVLSEPPRSWQGLTGHLDASQILKLEPNIDDKLYFVSGPEPMVESLVAELKTHGVDEHQLVTDYFPGYSW